MKFDIIRKDLFTVHYDYYLAHCIAVDCGMGAGIAVQFQKQFKLRNKIKKQNPKIGDCILVDRIFNLITKSRSSGKPSYYSLEAALSNMKHKAIELEIDKIAMPKIGCGLDRLQWGVVQEMIENIFQDTNIEILVCNWN